METSFESVTTMLEETVIHFFSPTGLFSAVILIILIVALFSGSGIEHRTMDGPAAGYQRASVSPILDTAR